MSHTKNINLIALFHKINYWGKPTISEPHALCIINKFYIMYNNYYDKDNVNYIKMSQ